MEKSDLEFQRRIEDLTRFCTEKAQIQFTGFLDGRQLFVAQKHCNLFSDDVISVSFGGVENAERKIVGMFPRFIYEYAKDDIVKLYEFFDIQCVCIRGSGYVKLTHRDLLGAILSLGISRNAVGDIYVTDDGFVAYCIFTSVAAGFVMSELSSIGREKVKTQFIPLENIPVFERKYKEISSTVASLRLDCIISCCCGLSRESAKRLITSKLVKVNHFECIRPDYEICEADLISVRGYGRFVVAVCGDVTKKGRNRVVIHKMI